MNMIKASVMAVLVAGCSIGVSAAPVDSVESSRATLNLQKVDAFVSQQAVADQLMALGLSREQVTARLGRMSAAQLEVMAAHVDMIRAGGTIQGTETSAGIISCIFNPLGRLIYNFYQLLFCWGALK
jgi:hypothetical protein